MTRETQGDVPAKSTEISPRAGDGPSEITGTVRARPAAPNDPDELRHEIERTREQLGETVEQLAAKVDVRKKAQDKAAEVRSQAKTKANELSGRAGQAARQAQQSARQHPVPLVAAAAAVGLLLAGYVVIRVRRSASGA